ncbi:MAG: type IV toxin-antitoxin system AbiEi family antitoxin domain-containing protein [Acidimicrobiia bacterium]
MNLAGISGPSREELAAVTARGHRLLTVEDTAERLGLDRQTAAKKLARWAEQGWLRRVRRGLYIPVPIDVADAVWSPCYFTGWTAASHWGLTEQVFRTIVVKTSTRVRSAIQTLLDQEYLVGHVPESHMTWGLRPEWREGRRLWFADEARTVIDMLDHPRIGGGVRHVAEVLEAYLSDFDWRQLVEYGDRICNRAVFKRLGCLSERLKLGEEALVEACRQRLSSGVVLLDPNAPDRGQRISEWGLRANVFVGADGSS